LPRILKKKNTFIETEIDWKLFDIVFTKLYVKGLVKTTSLLIKSIRWRVNFNYLQFNEWVNGLKNTWEIINFVKNSRRTFIFTIYIKERGQII